MTSKKLLFAFVILTFSVPATLAGNDAPNTQVRETITRSLPYLWEDGQAWIEKRGCVSCHQVPYMVWSLNAAAKHGFEVDQERLNKLNAWSTQIKNFDNPKNQQDRTEAEQAKANTDTMTHLLLALGKYESSLDSSWEQKFSDYLVAAQKEDGTWKPCGQLPFQKRSKEETTEATTTWTTLALLKQNKDSGLKTPIEKISNSISKNGTSTEWWAAQLLLAAQRNNSTKVKDLSEKLLSYQNEDGGWGWLVDEESDAFGTGLAIYALKQTNTIQKPEVIQNATKFLMRTQSDDGSWLVKSTKAKHQKQVTPTATYWGTAWAVLGLLETLDEQ